MGSTRQVTLMNSTRGGHARQGFDPPVTLSRGRGRGGRGGNRGRGGAGSRRGRGRGSRGSPANAAQISSMSSTSNAIPFGSDDDDDDLCLQALSKFETNDVTKAFDEINSSNELPGFDKITGDVWIYPTNRPVRDYQFNIVQTALYHNTMVSLPTGLGKTFIAAVVMYNFHRWYPNNLIVFMAPTRPLVTQQLDACHELMGIHPSKMVELTGQIVPKRREELWKEKKVFFLTPQVMTSDLERGSCIAENVRCIVVDEAHKTLGNHAYGQVIKMMVEKNKCFRVLALSATPGNDMTAVQDVLQNLLISRVELRSETSPDILPYTHAKQIETIVVPLDDHINSVHAQIVEIYQVYTGRLLKQNALFGGVATSFTPFQLLKARASYRQNQAPKIPNQQKWPIELDFATSISLAHSIDLLLIHGLRSFYSFLHGVLCKEKGSTPAVASELKKKTNLTSILEEVQEKLNISNENSFFNLSTSGLFTTFSNPSSSTNDLDLPEPTNPDDYLLSHPKMRVLRDLVQQHFSTHSAETRIMIFSEYRDSVQEIGNMLSALRPLVKPMVFLGQAKGAGVGGRGLKQKEQVQVVQSFRNGDFNVLVSTCVGEEGLDIGEVDLIICFDASKSPTRLVQRMGRTGRMREGKTIFLLSAGKEKNMYYSSVRQQQTISKNITDASALEQFLCRSSPRMVPAGVVPQCYKMNIILSSEQMQIDELEPEVIDINDESDIDESKDLRVSKKFVLNKKASRTNSAASTSSKGSGKGNKKEYNGNGRTSSKQDSEKAGTSRNPIQRCFENLQQKQKATETLTSRKVSNPPTSDNEVELLEIDENVLSVSQHRFEPEEEVGSGGDYQRHLKEMLGIKDLEAGSRAKCVFVPKLVKSDWKVPELLLEDLDVMAEINVEQLREELNSIYLLGASSDRCDCGMLLVDSEEMDSSPQDAGSRRCDHARLQYSHKSKKSLPPASPAPFENQASPAPVENQAFDLNDFGDASNLEAFENELESNFEEVIQDTETTDYVLDIEKEADAAPDPIDLAFETAFMEEDALYSPLPPEPEAKERSPIFKRRLLSASTPTLCGSNFVHETLLASMSKRNMATPPRQIDSDSAPDSPDFYPPSPVPVKNQRATQILNPDFRSDLQIEQHPGRSDVAESVKSKKMSTGYTSTPILSPLLAAQSSKVPIVQLSPPSSDATFYESDASQGRDDIEELSPIIRRSGVANPVEMEPPPRKFLFREATSLGNANDTNRTCCSDGQSRVVEKVSNIARPEVDGAQSASEKWILPLLERPLLDTTESDESPKHPIAFHRCFVETPPTVTAPPFVPETTDLFPVTPSRNRPAPKKLFKFKSRAEVQSTTPVVVPFKELLNFSSHYSKGETQITNRTEPNTNDTDLSDLTSQRLLSDLHKHETERKSPILSTNSSSNKQTAISSKVAETALPPKTSFALDSQPAIDSKMQNETRTTSVRFLEKAPFPANSRTRKYSSSDSDDLFFTPKTLGAAATASQTISPSSQRSPSIESIHLEDSPPAKSNARVKKKVTHALPVRKRRRVGNKFVADEAEVDGDESSDESEGDMDTYDDSFVAVEESPPLVSETQQVRYMASTKDTPNRRFGAGGRKKSLDEVAMEWIERAGDQDQSLEDYQLDDEEDEEDGRFCVPNDFIEYAASGDFTQRMDEARVALELESPSSRFKKNLRPRTRRQQQQPTFKAPLPIPSKKQPRKRILVVSSSDSE